MGKFGSSSFLPTLLVVALFAPSFGPLLPDFVNVVSIGSSDSSLDWVVMDNETRVDEIITLNGNLTVKSGGYLTLQNVTLYLNCSFNGEYEIRVETGGRLDILDGSNITSVLQDYHFLFYIENGSTFRMSDSVLSQCGYDWGYEGLKILTYDAIIRNCLITKNFYGVYCFNSSLTISNSTISENQKKGIFCYKSTLIIYNCTITGDGYVSTLSCSYSNLSMSYCTLNGESGEPIRCYDSNVTMFKCALSGNRIIFQSSNGTISECSFDNWSGIRCSRSSPTIFNCTIKNGGSIYCSYNSSPRISRCTFISSYGIICESSNPTITDCIMREGRQDGIACYNSNATISGCIITKNGNGVLCMRGSSPKISNCTISENWGNGIYCKEHYEVHYYNNPEVHYCNIYGNGGYELDNEDWTVKVNATYNYWVYPDSDSPINRPHYVNPEATDGNVLYTPWLTTPAFVVAETPDPFPPVTVHNYTGLWYNNNFTIHLTSTENISYIEGTYYKINGGPIRSLKIDGHPHITSENANNTLEYWSIDVVGNEEHHRVLTEIKLDKTAPTANAGQNKEAKVYSTVSFDAGSSTDNMGIASYEWSLGDGATRTSITVAHVYAAPGTYSVMLTVRDVAGNIATHQINVTILEAFPIWFVGVGTAVIVIALLAIILWRKGI